MSDLPKLEDPDLLEHVTMREAYLQAGRPRLCPRCGGRASGLHRPDCTTPGWTHAETCAKYRSADNVCRYCLAELNAE